MLKTARISVSQGLINEIFDFFEDVKERCYNSETGEYIPQNNPLFNRVQGYVKHQIDGNILSSKQFPIYKDSVPVKLKHNIFQSDGFLAIKLGVYVYDGNGYADGLFRQDTFSIFLNVNNNNIKQTIQHQLTHMVDMLLYVSRNIEQKPSNTNDLQLKDLAQAIKNIQQTATNINKNSIDVYDNIDYLNLKTQRQKNAEREAYLNSFLNDVKKIVEHQNKGVMRLILNNLINGNTIKKLQQCPIVGIDCDAYINILTQKENQPYWHKIKDLIGNFRNYPKKYKKLIKQIYKYLNLN